MSHKSKKTMLNLALISILTISMLILPLTLMIPQVSAAETVLTAKPWYSRSGLGTNWEGGVVLGDVTGDGIDDIVYGR